MAGENTNIPQVSTKVAFDTIVAAYGCDDKHPIMLWGPPGVGKTAIVYQAAKAIGGEVIDFRLVTTEPVDLRGYPVVVKDENDVPVGMRWVPADLLPKDPDWVGFIFLDELPQAPTMNMNAAAELVYDRRLGNDYNLPKGAMVVCAGNRRTDRAGTIEVPTHMKNRLIHLEIVANVEDWCVWAKSAGLHSGVINFLSSNPRLFHDFKPDAMAFPTPRSWEFVSDFYNNPALSAEVRRALVGGAVGKGPAVEIESFLDRGKGMPSYEDIVADPEHATTGDSENMAYALVTSICSNAKEEHLAQIVTYLKRHRREIVRVSAHRMISNHPEFLNHEGFAKFSSSLRPTT